MTQNGLEYDRKKFTPTNVNAGTNFGYIYPLMFVVVVQFWSCSNVKVDRHEFFGRVQIFWSYSFGHLESVKWLFLVRNKHYTFFFWAIFSLISSFTVWASRCEGLLSSLSGSVPAIFCNHINLSMPQAGFKPGLSVTTISWEIACCLRPLGHHGWYITRLTLLQILSVVYFKQQTCVPHAVCWLKSF